MDLPCLRQGHCREVHDSVQRENLERPGGPNVDGLGRWPGTASACRRRDKVRRRRRDRRLYSPALFRLPEDRWHRGTATYLRTTLLEPHKEFPREEGLARRQPMARKQRPYHQELRLNRLHYPDPGPG